MPVEHTRTTASMEFTEVLMEEGRAQLVLSSSDDEAAQTRRGTPDMVLCDVYQSARDIPVEQPLSIKQTIPANFGFVMPGVYRSSYPEAHHYPFLEGLKLKTIITLVAKDVAEGYQNFIYSNGIRHQVFPMQGTKKADIPVAMMRSIVELVVDRRNRPVLIHCNQGKHRTGCVVGVVRKYNGWDNASVLAEYTRLAAPKVRETDINYLSNFKLTSLRNIVARKIEGPRMNMVQALLLVLVSGLCLTIWLFTANQLLLPTLSQASRRTLRAIRPAKALLEC